MTVINILLFFKIGPSAPPVLPSQPEIPGQCGRGYDGYHYKYYKEEKTWIDAQTTCKNEGGNLAIINNYHTRDVVKSFMKWGWIGITDQWQEGIWQTPSGENVTFTLWRHGEPNNYLGDEDCAMEMEPGNWNDVDCNTVGPFVCQFHAGED